jgi:hypothetical protein
MIEVIESRTCDMPHEKPRKGETVRFDFNSHQYEMELCAKDKRALDQLADQYVPYARKAVTREIRMHRMRRRTDRQHSADIRAWAESQGIAVKPRGRIPGNIVAQYDGRDMAG